MNKRKYKARNFLTPPAPPVIPDGVWGNIGQIKGWFYLSAIYSYISKKNEATRADSFAVVNIIEEWIRDLKGWPSSPPPASSPMSDAIADGLENVRRLGKLCLYGVWMDPNSLQTMSNYLLQNVRNPLLLDLPFYPQYVAYIVTAAVMFQKAYDGGVSSDEQSNYNNALLRFEYLVNNDPEMNKPEMSAQKAQAISALTLLKQETDLNSTAQQNYVKINQSLNELFVGLGMYAFDVTTSELGKVSDFWGIISDFSDWFDKSYDDASLSNADFNSKIKIIMQPVLASLLETIFKNIFQMPGLIGPVGMEDSGIIGSWVKNIIDLSHHRDFTCPTCITNCKTCIQSVIGRLKTLVGPVVVTPFDPANPTPDSAFWFLMVIPLVPTAECAACETSGASGNTLPGVKKMWQNVGARQDWLYLYDMYKCILSQDPSTVCADDLDFMNDATDWYYNLQDRSLPSAPPVPTPDAEFNFLEIMSDLSKRTKNPWPTVWDIWSDSIAVKAMSDQFILVRDQMLAQPDFPRYFALLVALAAAFNKLARDGAVNIDDQKNYDNALAYLEYMFTKDPTMNSADRADALATVNKLKVYTDLNSASPSTQATINDNLAALFQGLGIDISDLTGDDFAQIRTMWTDSDQMNSALASQTGTITADFLDAVGGLVIADMGFDGIEQRLAPLGIVVSAGTLFKAMINCLKKKDPNQSFPALLKQFNLLTGRIVVPAFDSNLLVPGKLDWLQLVQSLLPVEDALFATSGCGLPDNGGGNDLPPALWGDLGHLSLWNWLYCMYALMIDGRTQGTIGTDLLFIFASASFLSEAMDPTDPTSGGLTKADIDWLTEKTKNIVVVLDNLADLPGSVLAAIWEDPVSLKIISDTLMDLRNFLLDRPAYPLYVAYLVTAGVSYLNGDDTNYNNALTRLMDFYKQDQTLTLVQQQKGQSAVSDLQKQTNVTDSFKLLSQGMLIGPDSGLDINSAAFSNIVQLWDIMHDINDFYDKHYDDVPFSVFVQKMMTAIGFVTATIDLPMFVNTIPDYVIAIEIIIFELNVHLGVQSAPCKSCVQDNYLTPLNWMVGPVVVTPLTGGVSPAPAVPQLGQPYPVVAGPDKMWLQMVKPLVVDSPCAGC